MSDFKAKMHQIQFRLGAPPQTLLGEFTALPTPDPKLNLRGQFLRKGEGLRRREKEGEEGFPILFSADQRPSGRTW